ncbi:DUF2975 domain-containing protein [Sphingomonas aestuarii]
MLNVVRRLLQILLVLNWVAVAGFIAFAGFLALAPEYMAGQFTEDFGANADAARDALIGMMAVGIVAAFPVHLIFTRLIAMIDTVRVGQPFTAANADRLRLIAWGMLALQFIDIAFGWFAWRLGEATGELIGWQFSVTGWLAVLLLFVLARVFQQGAAMQDELEATV